MRFLQHQEVENLGLWFDFLVKGLGKLMKLEMKWENLEGEDPS